MRRHAMAILILAALLAGCSKAPAPKPVVPKSAPSAAAPEPAVESKESLSDKAFAAIQAKDWPTAVQHAEQAVKLDPEYAPARFNLGLAYYRAGQYPEALPHLQKAYARNEQQVEPGWFLALTQEQLGDIKQAETLLSDLARRFPDDADVAGALARVAPPLKLWPLPPDSQHVTFLGDVCLFVASDNEGILAWDSRKDGVASWAISPQGKVMRLLPDDTGRRLAVFRELNVTLYDVDTGKPMGAPATLHWADPNGKGGPRTFWRGDYLWVGLDQWGGPAASPRYLSTAWLIYRTGPDGIQKVGDVANLGQTPSLSLDGRLAVMETIGQGNMLFRDGLPQHKVAGRLLPVGDLLYIVGADQKVAVTDLAGNAMYSVTPPPGFMGWHPWGRPDGTWFLATTNQGGLIAYREAEAAFSYQGALIGMSPKYLLVRTDAGVQVLDGAGQVVRRLPLKDRAWITPDQKWVYDMGQGEVKAYRLP